MSKQKTRWRSVIEVPASGETGMWGGAYTLAYVYSSKGNFLVKGYLREVEKYIEQTFKEKYFVNLSLWHRGKHRDIWKFWKDKVQMNAANPFRYNDRKPDPKHRKWEIYSGSGPDRIEVKFKRIPKRWVPELEVF